MSLRCVPFL
uniref:Uncharacterized protein n=1 Tax=Arundo donax TaxID=35708 RepID=A0A0A9EFW1_ARUDO